MAKNNKPKVVLSLVREAPYAGKGRRKPPEHEAMVTLTDRDLEDLGHLLVERSELHNEHLAGKLIHLLPPDYLPLREFTVSLVIVARTEGEAESVIRTALPKATEIEVVYQE